MWLPESQEKTRGKAGHSSSSEEQFRRKMPSWICEAEALLNWGGNKDQEVVLAGSLSWVRALPLKWGWYKADLPPGMVALSITYHPPAHPTHRTLSQSQDLPQLWSGHRPQKNLWEGRVGGVLADICKNLALTTTVVHYFPAPDFQRYLPTDETPMATCTLCLQGK